MPTISKQNQRVTVPIADVRIFDPRFLKVSKLLGLFIVVILVGVVSYFYGQKENTQSAVISPPPHDQVAELVAEVGKIIVLPTDEMPTVAIVSDPEVLKQQVFFITAKKGDRVLLYPRAHKVILYDPIVHKIIDVATLQNVDGVTGFSAF
jgi:hypothetical protein